MKNKILLREHWILDFMEGELPDIDLKNTARWIGQCESDQELAGNINALKKLLKQHDEVYEQSAVESDALHDRIMNKIRIEGQALHLIEGGKEGEVIHFVSSKKDRTIGKTKGHSLNLSKKINLQLV